MLEPNPKFPYSPIQIYPSFEGDLSLGNIGAQVFPPITLPKNYEPINVKDEIKNISDADGMAGEDLGLCFRNAKQFQFPCRIKNEGWDYVLCDFMNKLCHNDIGYNHAGYIGFRNLTDTTKLVDDGAISITVKNWNHTTS